MEILYISNVCSSNVFERIFKGILNKSGIAVQKFHYLLLCGFAANSFNSVKTLSTLPISPSIHKKRIWNIAPDFDKRIQFNYIPVLNIPILKNLIVFVYSFFKFLFWEFPYKKNNLIICDILSLSITAAAFFAFKLRRMKIIALVTDLPGINVMSEKITLRDKVVNFFSFNFDGYVLLTKQMNCLINPKNKPFLIMEGMVNSEMNEVKNTLSEKNKEKIIIYAGGLYEKYGIVNLIEGFFNLKNQNARLHLYGNGPIVEKIREYANKDPRIKYMGVVPNRDVIKAQEMATLLINPRPSAEEFSKFSFPSKNMEYMVSGTPVVTTLLPGMPEEYREFVYLIQDESPQGIYKTLESLLNQTDEQLHLMGQKAKDFVIKNKNNLLQAQRIIDFFEQELFNR